MAGLTRDEFLGRVRVASARKIPPHTPEVTPPEGQPGRMESVPSLAERFGERAEAAGMQVHRASDLEEARTLVARLVRNSGSARVLVWPEIATMLDLAAAVSGDGISVGGWDASEPHDDRKAKAFAMDCGVTGVDYAVAETGSLVVCSSPEHGRSVSLLGKVHIALVREEQILPDLDDLFPRVRADHPDALPSNVTLITGPSKTADIELQLVVGVHGPAEVHVVLVKR
jgi:L-lactate dehydrogenase complex protein LldG